MMKCEEENAELRSVWRRIHRPEDYAPDVSRFIASELKLPFFLVKPLIPIAASILRKWEDAAVETTALYTLPAGARILRTFFQITDYSSESFYGLVEKILKKLGVGTSLSKKYGDTDFAWILLGGVLDDYASCAGLCKNTSIKLVDFRFPLSDYFTSTTWFPAFVEIANLKTGRVDRLELPPGEIKKIVDWALAFEEKKCCSHILPNEVDDPVCKEFFKLDSIYRKVKTENL